MSRSFGAFVWAAGLMAQPPDPSSEIQAGQLIPPRQTKSPQPKYTREAREFCVEGSVLAKFVVDVNGRATQVRVIAPLGYGLDEELVKTTDDWRFEPAQHEGVPVPFTAVASTNFRLTADPKKPPKCAQREIALALSEMSADPQKTPAALAVVAAWKKKKFATAEYLTGRWMLDGSNGMARDEAGGMALIQSAAENNLGQAIYFLATRKAAGEPVDWTQLERAARFGSREAQFAVAERLERGTDGAERDAERALGYYWQCARAGDVRCQLSTGRLLTLEPRTHIYAIAWLEIAERNGAAAAKDWLTKVLPSATPQRIANARRFEQEWFPTSPESRALPATGR